MFLTSNQCELELLNLGGREEGGGVKSKGDGSTVKNSISANEYSYTA